MSKKLFIATNVDPAPNEAFLAELLAAADNVKGWEIVKNTGGLALGHNGLDEDFVAMKGCDAFVGVLKEPGYGLGAYAVQAAELPDMPSLILIPEGGSLPELALEGPYFYPQSVGAYTLAKYSALAVDLQAQVAENLS
ncbi:MAG: hypothetical protein JWM81_255 [Candidatus Saccharibacteria bacterium]|nr:hypothetical protein [Candidatus Saccharibacteria bacterium]